jgi:hypothetical protein
VGGYIFKLSKERDKFKQLPLAAQPIARYEFNLLTAVSFPKKVETTRDNSIADRHLEPSPLFRKISRVEPSRNVTLLPFTMSSLRFPMPANIGIPNTVDY